MPDAIDKAWVVCLEIKRIQTWLFSVPKLQPMVGANAILAKLMEKTLPHLAVAKGAALPVADRTCGEKAPAWIAGDHLASWDDPLNKKTDPILVRQAGRFHAVFVTEDAAKQFARAAAQAIGDACGDVRVQCEIEALECRSGAWRCTGKVAIAEVAISGGGNAVFESSLLQPCEASGLGVAAHRVGGRNGARKLRVSADVIRRQNAFGDHEAAKGEDCDLVKRFYQGVNKLGGYRQPNDFSDLADGGYLAVLCADGNGVGAGRADAEGNKDDDYFARWRRTEAYFLRTRSRIRAALATALADTKGLINKKETLVRYRMLMLGGDDILLVCRADRVLELASKLSQALDAINASGEASASTTIGIGIAIVHPKFPFRRAHELAEALMASAKKRSRSQTCVDWEVVTAAALPDLQALRHAQWVTGGDAGVAAIASLRPYPGHVLAQMVEKAQKLVPEEVGADLDRGARIGRGQWRRLAEQTLRGMFLGELAKRELRPTARTEIDAAVKAVANIWAGAPQPPKPHGTCDHWYPIGAADAPVAWGTPLLDLIEVAHIHTLGSRGVAHDDLQAEETEAGKGAAVGGALGDTPDQVGAA